MNIEKLSWREVAKIWSKGENVWSAELGGIGPGYEQAIQILLFEILARWPEGKEVPQPEGDKIPAEFGEHADSVADDLNKSLGFSGAQVGVARTTAYQFMLLGYSEMMDKLPEDRKILVSKGFPRVPDPEVGMSGDRLVQ